MITKYLKIVDTNNQNSNLLLVEMSQEMYQYICYILLQKEHEVKVDHEISVQKKIKNKVNKENFE